MDFWQAVSSGFRKYTDFNGRAVRSEFWHFQLFLVIVGFCLMPLDSYIFGVGFTDDDIGPLSLVWTFAAIIPQIAVGARRLHDIGRSGWWLLLILTIVGIVVLIVWWCYEGEGNNQYGSTHLPVGPAE